jgi:hypothetical protein
MPYELSFTKAFTVGDREGEEEYFNDCCWGCDVIGRHLEPLIAKNYQPVKVEQEDWGWYLWFEQNGVGLELNIMCDDQQAGTFRIHVVSTESPKKQTEIVDTPQLEVLRDLVVPELKRWAGEVAVVKVDDNFLPVN